MSTSEQGTTEPQHTHCWHRAGFNGTVVTYLSYPAQHDERCCHCGATRRVVDEPPPIPDGHGPYHPNARPQPVPVWAAGPCRSGSRP